MTETSSTTTPATVVFPPGRYGRRRDPRKRRPWLLVALVAAALVVGAAVSVRLYQNYGDPAYDAQVVTYTDITDNQILVVFRVNVPADGTAICVVRARSRDGAEVGREEVRVDAPADGSRPQVSHHLATTARAMIGEVPRCREA